MKITEELNLEEKTDDTPSSTPESRLSERDKLKAMTRKDRIWYIWEYYKFHMVGVVIALTLVWVVGTSMYRGSFDTVFYCMYLNSRSETELNMAPLEQGFAQHLDTSSKELIAAESSFISYGNDATEFSYATMAKISALVASKDLDVIIGDMDTLKHYASLEGFSDYEAELPADLLTMVQDHLIYAPGEDGVERAYGISLAGTTFAAESNLAQDPPVLGFINNSTHKENQLAFLRYVFAQ